MGIVLGAWVGERIERASYQMDLPLPLGRLAQIAIVTVFVITAAAQIAVPTIVLMVPIGLALATIGAAFALAFGLGGRDVARAVSAGRYVRSTYAPGQTITVGDITGTVQSIEGATTVLDADDGRTVRVPTTCCSKASSPCIPSEGRVVLIGRALIREPWISALAAALFCADEPRKGR